ncbi:MAG: NADH-quinone oxidoreductase subunit L [Candidatus Tectomicrobia bacterium]|uniref:NADH-quinone oxidoreductase subunit L n=1 Tax=Tectimicrobiota bacterium TaxID=2528274 RepID=A0A932MQ42_UNCTE|nr:NADH-quinone oxidoreductase subunit L [Candidatus Tectomicrobia bacterium]
MIRYAWLIPLFPLAGVLINGLLGSRTRGAAGHLATLMAGLSFLVVLGISREMILGPGGSHTVAVWDWITAGKFSASLSFLIDPLSTIMLLVVTGVGFVIHLYSIGYMHGDPGYPRFFTYLNLFMVSMLLLVMGDNYLVMFVGWEGVGLCSYLLIGFWYEKKSASDAGKKAFIVNRIGDAGFLLGMFLIWSLTGSLAYGEAFKAELAAPAATAIGLLLFIGAMGKSAQIPLYVWLPDAMEGPTPVSALIHAATMVTAGVYMVARTSPIYVQGPAALEVVALVGALTAIFAASIGLVQNDIKRVLAYSTVSQLGFMFMALGVGAFASGIFHLMTHAFFKGLLFLGSGSVIHALHHAPADQQQDMRYMGGLRSKMPVTYGTFLIGAIAIAGVPPFAGFWSKDEILAGAFFSGHYLVWGLGTAAAFMTAFYMFRLIFMTFHGEMRVDHHAREHIHESPATMTVPLVILAVLSVVGGILPGFPPDAGWIHKFLAPSLAKAPAAHAAAGEGYRIVKAAAGAGEPGGGHGTVGIVLIALAIAVALGGIALAWRMYMRDTAAPGRLAARFPGLYRVLLNKYYVDEFYQACIVEPIYRLMRALFNFDQRVVDGAVNGSSFLTVWTSRLSGLFDLRTVDGAVNGTASVLAFFAQLLKFIQSGMVQNYLFMMLLGVFLMVSAYLFR